MSKRGNPSLGNIGKIGLKPMVTSAIKKTNQKSISSIYSLESPESPLDQLQKNALVSKFIAFRKILEGNQNLPLAVFVKVLDHCFAYSKVELFHNIHLMLHTYNYLFLDDSQGTLTLMERLSVILYGSEEIKEKMKHLEEIYNTQAKDLEMIVRNLVKIVNKLNYYKKSITACLNLRPIATLEPAFQNGLLELKDFLLFLIDSQVQLKVIDLSTNQITSYGNRPVNFIYLLKTAEGLYYPIITSDEYNKISFSFQEYPEMYNFIQKINMKEPQINLEEVKVIKDEISRTEDEINAYMNVLKQLNTSLNTSRAFNDVKEILDDNRLEITVAKFCCSLCFNLEKSAEFPCGHLFCYNCSYTSFDNNYRYCSICRFSAKKEVIDNYFI